VERTIAGSRRGDARLERGDSDEEDTGDGGELGGDEAQH